MVLNFSALDVSAFYFGGLIRCFSSIFLRLDLRSYVNLSYRRLAYSSSISWLYLIIVIHFAWTNAATICDELFCIRGVYIYI